MIKTTKRTRRNCATKQHNQNTHYLYTTMDRLHTHKHSLQNQHSYATLSGAKDKDDLLVLKAFHENMSETNKIRKAKNLPLAKYDTVTKKAYLEYPDGKIVYYGN